MSDELVVPEPLRDLGQALQALLQRLRAELATNVVATTRVADPVATLSRHLHALPQLADRLVARLDDLNADVAANPQAGAADVQRAVGRLARCIDAFLEGLREAQSLRSGGAAAEMPLLLAGAYRHALGEIAQWLERIVNALADPAAEYARQGLPTDVPGQMHLALQLTAPPQMQGIHQWIGRQKSPRALSLMDKASALVLGWALAGALFNDCD